MQRFANPAATPGTEHRLSKTSVQERKCQQVRRVSGGTGKATVSADSAVKIGTPGAGGAGGASASGSGGSAGAGGLAQPTYAEA